MLDVHLVQDCDHLDKKTLSLFAPWGSERDSADTTRLGSCKAPGVIAARPFAHEAVDSRPYINRGLGDSWWSAVEHVLDLSCGQRTG